MVRVAELRLTAGERDAATRLRAAVRNAQHAADTLDGGARVSVLTEDLHVILGQLTLLNLAAELEVLHAE